MYSIEKKETVQKWFRDLRNQFICEFEKIESSHSFDHHLNPVCAASIKLNLINLN